MGSGKASKIAYYKAQIEVRDKIVAGLVGIIASNKINIPENLVAVMEIVYFNKFQKVIKNVGNGNNKSGEAEGSEKEKEKEAGQGD